MEVSIPNDSDRVPASVKPETKKNSTEKNHIDKNSLNKNTNVTDDTIESFVMPHSPIELNDEIKTPEILRDFERAKKLAEEGRENQALVSSADFLRRYPHHVLAVEIQYLVGDIYFRRQNYELARVEFQKVLSYTGKGALLKPEASIAIGECWRKLGRIEFARIEWQAVLRKFPENSAAKKAQENLMSIP